MNVLQKKTKELAFNKAKWIEMIIEDNLSSFYKSIFKSKLVPQFIKMFIAKFQKIEIVERFNGNVMETAIKKDGKIIGTHKIKIL